ncbi:glycerate kinase [Variovorax sp. HJSM1_2]|uniref:glycerate kinase n=1 Tax=Variovorax sp. HJSM1_2 TaxID=3366263 RepID=UPI003BE88F25
MNWKNYAYPLVGLALLVVAFQRFGWMGVLAVTGGLVMWALLHITRTMQVLKKAADRPIGYVASAVMLNAKLKPGVNLLHVMAMTRSLGELRSPKDQQPEIFRWTDGSQSHVTCEFFGGKLVKWVLERPTEPTAAVEDSPVQP